MADSEEIKDTSTRLLATAAFASGVGAAVYKGFDESPGAIERIAKVVGSNVDHTAPSMMTRTPVDNMSALLSEGFSAMEDTMGGNTEMLRRSYTRALYSSGIVSDEDRGALVEKLVAGSSDWNSAEVTIGKYERELGGTEGVHKAMREISGGTISGNRRKDIGQLISEFSDIEPDNFGRAGDYPRSSFEPNGRFWSERFGLKVDESVSISTKPISQKLESDAEKLQGAFGNKYKVNAGIRGSNRPRRFEAGQQGSFSFSVPNSDTNLDLSYSEFRVGKSLGGKDNRWFLSAPRASTRDGINFVAADHRGMSMASVPHFSVPKGGKKVGNEIVSWNEGLEMMLHGDKDRGIEGLAVKLQKFHGDEKAMRDLTKEWNTKISGLFHRVTGSQGNMTQARMHSDSVLPLNRLLGQIFGEDVDKSIEGLTDFYQDVSVSAREKGLEVGPLAGADPMVKQYRVGLRDWGKRWDVFGKDYSIERKFAGRVKPFDLTASATEAMLAKPIGGVLKRGHGITTTAAARAEMSQMPQVGAYLTLGEARHFGEEESVISKRLAPMMEAKDVKTVEIFTGSSQAGANELLKQGTPIGVDYRTGETILAKGSKGTVEQRIVHSRQVGDITQLTVETTLPLQDQMKIFGYKSQVQIARGSIGRELMHEWGASAAGMKHSKEIEFIGHADLMKKIPQEVNKQMAEAQWMIMRKRLDDAGVLHSGGRGKVVRQRLRKIAGKKTYTYKGGLAKDYVDVNMVKFVRDEQYRDKVLSNRQKAGSRLAKRLKLGKDQEALGVGLELMRYAKKHKMDKEELGLIGGAFYKQLVDTVGDTKAESLLGKVGLGKNDIAGLKDAKGVLAMPTMHIGGFASFDHKWGRAGMDYRALMEVSAQKWGEAGDLLVEDIARRVIPAQNLAEMEKAALSITGRVDELPDGIERVTKIREAQESLGKKSFIFDYGGKEVYVPRADKTGISGAMNMGEFSSEVGDVANQELRAAYSNYFKAQKAVRDLPGEMSDKGLSSAQENLERKIHKGWAASTSLKGKVVGTSGPVARRRVPGRPEDTLARVFGSTKSTLDDATKQFVNAGEQVFTVGITRETGSKMFRDLMSKADDVDRTFLEAQEQLFLSGEKVTGFVYRHPTHRPQSLLPTWLELVEGKGESAQFHRMEMKYGDEVLDVSQAAGMKLDYDFDHVQLGLISQEKVKIAQDKLMNSRAYREQFIEGVAIQSDIMKRVKAAAANGVVDKNVESYVAGLKRLVGVKMETGTISNLVGEMRAAAAFQSSSQEFKIASYLLAELEEGPISSKHGLHAGNIKTKLKEFVKGDGPGVRDAMREAWGTIFEEGNFTAGKIKYSREEFIDKMGGWISAAEESGELAAFRDVARRGAKAQKGAEWERLTMEKLSQAIDQFQGGRGDLNAALTRTMRMGPGSSISTSRAVADGLKGMAQTVGRALKKRWYLPALGAAAAVGISSLGGGSLNMSDHNRQVDGLGGGPGVPHISAPQMNPNRIVTSGGGGMPAGYGMHTTGDFNSQGLRQLNILAGEIGASVRMRDDRGSITPQYIDKAQRERYY